MKGNGASSLSNAVMNIAANEKTGLKSKGVSKADGKGACPMALRMKDEWRASTVKMDPAAARKVLSTRDPAAPR